MKKTHESEGRVEWEPIGVLAHELISLSDYREKLKNENDADLQLKKHKEKLMELFDMKLEWKENGPINTEVYSSEWMMGMRLYFLFIKNKNLIGYQLINVKGDNSEIMVKLLDRTATRMNEICD